MSSDRAAIIRANSEIEVFSLLRGTLSILRAISAIYDTSGGFLDWLDAAGVKEWVLTANNRCIRVGIQDLSEDEYDSLIETSRDHLGTYYLGEGEGEEIYVCGDNIDILITGIEAVNRIDKVINNSFEPIYYHSFRTRRGYEPLYNRLGALNINQLSDAERLVAGINSLNRVSGREILDGAADIISNHYRPPSSHLLAIIENSTRETEHWKAMLDTGDHYDHSLVISLPRVVQGIHGELIRQALIREARGQPFLFDVTNNKVLVESDDEMFVERLLIDLIAVDTVLMLAAGTDSLVPIVPYVISS
jgi:hypothetical protein